MLVPTVDIARVAGAHARFIDAIAVIDDEHARRPSGLPGWTVGHVLTHVARNADSHVRRAQAAIDGVVVDQYDGGLAARDEVIDAGASRPAAALVDDVRSSAAAVDETWASLPVSAWTGRTRDANGRERPLFELPSRRWQEVEVHLLDVHVGVTHRDWPEEFLLEWIPRTRERMWPAVATDPPPAAFEHPADELAWFYGRLARPDLPPLPAWG